MSRNLVEESIRDVFDMNYCAATKGIKFSVFLFVENATTEVIHCGVLDETPNQSFSRWSRSDAFMQVSVERIAKDSGFIKPVAAFVWQSAVKAVKLRLKQRPKVTMDIPTPPDCPSSASTRATSNVHCRTKHSGHKRCGEKDWKHRDGSKESREKRWEAHRARSFYNLDSSLMTPKSKSSD